MWFSRSKPQPETPFFSWSDQDHGVGVPAFDREHKDLARKLNLVHDALRQKPDRARALQVMEDMIQATRAHFAHEEQALEAVGYPDRAAHAAEHAALLEEALDLVHQFKGGTISALSLPSFLRKWLIPHIQQTDRKYQAALRQVPLS